MPFEHKKLLQPKELYYAMVGMVQKSPHRFRLREVISSDDRKLEYARVYWDLEAERNVFILSPSSLNADVVGCPTLEHIINHPQLQKFDNEVFNKLVVCPIMYTTFAETQYYSVWRDDQYSVIEDSRASYVNNDDADSVDFRAVRLNNFKSYLENISGFSNIEAVQHDWRTPNENWKSGYDALHTLYNLIHKPQTQHNIVNNERSEGPVVDTSFIARMKARYHEGKHKRNTNPPKKIKNLREAAIRDIRKQIFKYGAQLNPFLKKREVRVQQLRSLLKLVENPNLNINEAITLWKNTINSNESNQTNAELMVQHFSIFCSIHDDSKTRLAKFIQKFESKYADVANELIINIRP